MPGKIHDGYKDMVRKDLVTDIETPTQRRKEMDSAPNINGGTRRNRSRDISSQTHATYPAVKIEPTARAGMQCLGERRTPDSVYEKEDICIATVYG